jgi:hypothetical protein
VELRPEIGAVTRDEHNGPQAVNICIARILLKFGVNAV